MARNVSALLGPTFTLSPSASAFLDVRMDDIANLHLMFQQVYASISATTGCQINIYSGWGGPSSNETPNAPIPNVYNNSSTVHGASTVLWSNNYTPVTSANGFVGIVTPTSSAKTTNTAFYLNNVVVTWGRWISFQVYNTDPVNNATVQFYADLS